VDDAALLEVLAPEAARLLDRHLATARPWLPHELVPWERATATATPPAPPGVASAMTVNVLTEDALPYYTVGLHARLGEGAPWWDWVRRWTAEEQRHGTVLHDYIALSRIIDPGELERQRLAYLSAAPVPTAPTVLDAFVYLALQELATRTAHANTGRFLPDREGRRLLAQVAADEHLHHLFYRDLVTEALRVAPTATLVAIDRQVRHFSMPGAGIPGFADHARAIAAAGIYSTTIYLEQVVVPLVQGPWHPDADAPLDPEADAAHRRTLAFVERLTRIAPRLGAPAGGGRPAAGAPPGSS